MSQKGFAPIIFILGILIISGLIVGGSFYLKNSTNLGKKVPAVSISGNNNQKETQSTDNLKSTENRNSLSGKKDRAVFAVFEDLKLNVYSTKLDGSDKRQLLSYDIDEPSTRSRPDSILAASVSPGGELIAYKYKLPPALNYTSSDPPDLFLIDSSGQNKRNIAKNIEQFIWSPDGKNILYSANTPLATYQDSRGSVIEAPLVGPGSQWYIYDTQSSREQMLDIKDNIYNSTRGFIDNEHIIFVATSAYGGIPSQLFVYDLKNSKVFPVKVEGEQISDAAGNSSQGKAVVSILPKDYGINYSCDLYEMNTKGEITNHLVKSPNYQCGLISWNGNDEIIYEKGTGPKGKIETSQSDESGYYILSSVYKYNFQTKKEEVLVKNTGKEIFKFMGALENQALIVSNESAKRTPHYILEVRNLDGSNPRILISSNKEILFVGFSN